MTPIELFEKTMSIINKEINLNEGRAFLECKDIKDLINDKKLPEACKKLHKFLREDLDKSCFQREFQFAYALDNCVELDYENCFDKSDRYIECCENCSNKKGEGYKYNDELEHFLTHLLFEYANGKQTALMYPVREKGLFLLAAEVLEKDNSENSSADKAVECLRQYKEKIKNEKECSSQYVKMVSSAAIEIVKPIGVALRN